MATMNLQSITGYMKFANGSTSSGTTKYLSVSIGALDASNWDPTKAYTVAQALRNLYEKTYAGLYPVAKYMVTNE